MKTASSLAILFPGAGHFYSGHTGKGFLFTALEVAALLGITISNNNYIEKLDVYNAWEDSKIGGNWSASEGAKLHEDKNVAIAPLIGSCTAAGVVWILNYLDIKKTGNDRYSSDQPVSIGLNSYGQVEVHFSF